MPARIEGWRDKTPDSFGFSLKVPQVITHEEVLLNCQHELDAFLSAARLLGDMLLCCLLKFGYFNQSAFAVRDALTGRTASRSLSSRVGHYYSLCRRRAPRCPFMDWKFVANCLVTILAILDPFGALAMFLALLGDATHEQRRHAVRLTTLTVLSTLTVAMLFGRQLLTLLGISMGAFRVAGGMIILLTGLKMLGGHLGSERRASEALVKVSPQPELQAIVPLGTPLIAGAGSISTVILFEQTAPNALHVGAVAAAVVVCSALLFVILRAADQVAGALGEVGMSIAVRLMGLILVAMGVQFMANGLLDLFPLLARASG